MFAAVGWKASETYDSGLSVLESRGALVLKSKTHGERAFLVNPSTILGNPCTWSQKLHCFFSCFKRELPHLSPETGVFACNLCTLSQKLHRFSPLKLELPHFSPKTIRVLQSVHFKSAPLVSELSHFSDTGRQGKGAKMLKSRVWEGSFICCVSLFIYIYIYIMYFCMWLVLLVRNVSSSVLLVCIFDLVSFLCFEWLYIVVFVFIIFLLFPFLVVCVCSLFRCLSPSYI